MRHLFSLLLALGLILTSCELDSGADDRGPAPLEFKIELSEQTMEVEYELQEYSIYVTSPDFWVATTQSEWITIVTDSGVEGKQELIFSVERNEDIESRSGVITIENEAGTLSTELNVVQRPFVPTEISLSSASLKYGYEGGRQEVAVSANFDYEVDVDCEWITYENISNGISIIVEPSVVCQKRTAEVVIYSQRYDISKSIAVEQAPFEPYFEVEAKSVLDFDYEGGVKSISISSNFEYDVISDSDWVVINKTAKGIDVVVEPLYPIMNIPRSTSIIISDTRYDYGDTEVVISQSCKESDFQVGEMVEYGGAIGIVFYRDATITKIVSVEQGKAKWSTEFISVGATDYDNGMNNMTVVQGVDQWESKYPAFVWCANLGDGWYLPAYSELYDIWEVKSTLNEALEANGYTALGVDYNYYYWSSTECDDNNVFKLYFSTGVWDRYYKYGEYYIRAVYQF